MLDRIEELKTGAQQELDAIKDDRELEAWRVKYLGRKSDLTGILRGLAQLPIEERRTVGAKAGELKNILLSMDKWDKEEDRVSYTIYLPIFWENGSIYLKSSDLMKFN